MKYLLDTCVLSDFVRGEPGTLAQLKATSAQAIAISSVTLMEIEFGLALNIRRAQTLAPVLHAILNSISVLPYRSEDARSTATLRAALQKRGRSIGPYDALIAGCALTRGFVLVTSNEREFRRITGLAVENWRG